MGVWIFSGRKYGGPKFFREKIPGALVHFVCCFSYRVLFQCSNIIFIFILWFFVWSQRPMRDLKKNGYFGKTLGKLWSKEIWIFSESIQQILVSSGLFIRYRVWYIHLWQLILYIHIVDTMYIPDMKYIFIYCVNHSFYCPLKFLVS